MKMKKIYILIGLVFVAILISGLIISYNKKAKEVSTTPKPAEIITIGGIREDEIDPGPIEDECQRRMESYIKGVEFKNKGFFKCRLIESKVGFGEKECPGGFSPQGCAICKLECK